MAHTLGVATEWQLHGLSHTCKGLKWSTRRGRASTFSKSISKSICITVTSKEWSQVDPEGPEAITAPSEGILLPGEGVGSETLSSVTERSVDHHGKRWMTSDQHENKDMINNQCGVCASNRNCCVHSFNETEPDLQTQGRTKFTVITNRSSTICFFSLFTHKNLLLNNQH